jgi:plastocyanin
VTKLAVTVALVLAALAASGVSASRADAPTRTVTIPGKAYDPSHVTVLVGTTVTWKNEDSINHTVTADGDAFSSGYVPPGGSFAFTFAQQGRYPFHCTIHRFMRGEVDVFGLVLTGPEGAVGAGHRVVFAGLAPAGTASVALRGPHGDIVVKPRADGSFAVRTAIGEPGSYRAVASALVSPVVRVQVRPAVHASAARGRVRATVSPGRPGATAELQAYDRERFAWKTVARGTLDRASRVTLRVPNGVGRARVLVVGSRGWADGVSQPIVLRGV